ncbi:hypothetical protein [Carp edema virus]|nr:hypothetical protein [Carp edema virus]
MYVTQNITNDSNIIKTDFNSTNNSLINSNISTVIETLQTTLNYTETLSEFSLQKTMNLTTEINEDKVSKLITNNSFHFVMSESIIILALFILIVIIPFFIVVVVYGSKLISVVIYLNCTKCNKCRLCKDCNAREEFKKKLLIDFCGRYTEAYSYELNYL